MRTFPLACHKLCTESSCTLYLKAGYSVKCEGEKYHFFKLVAFGASSYVVVLPGLVLVALWRHRKKQVLRDESDDEEAVGSNKIVSEFDDIVHCASEIREENDEVNGDDDAEEGKDTCVFKLFSTRIIYYKQFVCGGQGTHHKVLD